MGGEGLACPAGICNLIWAHNFLSHDYSFLTLMRSFIYQRENTLLAIVVLLRLQGTELKFSLTA